MIGNPRRRPIDIYHDIDMSAVRSGCSADLLCGEESDEVFSGESPDCSSEIDSSTCTDESSIAGFIEDESNFVPGMDYMAQFRSESLDASAREKSVSWILKVQAYYQFQPLTAYLSVNYLDRFLYARRLPQSSGWPLQLLSVACLSLAAKMEEPLVPALVDLQVEGANYLFESKTIQRMELLVLSELDWRLRSVTPFSFIDFFAWKLDPAGDFVPFLISRATVIILSNIKEASFLEYGPSSIAAAGILCAANEIPKLSLSTSPELAQSWCDGLSKEKIRRCYRQMQEEVGKRSESSSSSSSSCSSSSPSYKRRRLSSSLRVDDDKVSSD